MLTETTLTLWSGLAGGVLIGCAATLLLWLNGRIAGISGIVGGLIAPSRGEVSWRLVFVLGLLLGGSAYAGLTGSLNVDIQVSWPLMLVAGFLVGVGTRLGSGCTSGHGVCGIGRLSRRSIVATAVFFIAAMATVFTVRHFVGVNS